MQHHSLFFVLVSILLAITACDTDKGTRPGEGPPEYKEPPLTPGNVGDQGRAGSTGGSTGGPSSGGIGTPTKPQEEPPSQ